MGSKLIIEKSKLIRIFIHSQIISFLNLILSQEAQNFDTKLLS